jgi:hypothetical protein
MQKAGTIVALASATAFFGHLAMQEPSDNTMTVA